MPLAHGGKHLEIKYVGIGALWCRFATFVLFKAQDFYWPKIYFTKFKKRAFSCFFLKKAVFRCSFWFLAVFVFVTIVLFCLSSA